MHRLHRALPTWRHHAFRAASSSSSEAPEVLSDVADGVCTLTLNAPHKRNALSSSLMGALRAGLADAEARDDVRVVVIGANGPVFCSGHDLKEMRSLQEASAFQQTGSDITPDPRIAALFAQCSELMLAIGRLRQPVVAKVGGVATAAGCQLVASCDLAVAAGSATFATPGVHIGLFCSTPAVALSRAVGRKAAMGMLLTGAPVSADEAVAQGLINRAVPAGELDACVAELAATIASKPPLAQQVGKAAFYEQLAMADLEEAYAASSQVMTDNLVRGVAREGIGAFLEKRKPNW
jgi:enoyl-CoA hydratase/carnithine racemase